MDINSRGDIWHGIGGGFVNLNNEPIARGGTGGFVNDDLCVFANGEDVNPETDAWIVTLYDLKTKQLRRAIENPAHEQYRQGGDLIYAGGGVWAAWFGNRSDHRGLYASTGLRLRDAGLLGVGPDGAIGYKPSYLSGGPSLVIEQNGEVWPLTDGHAADLRLLGAHRAIWTEGGRVRTAGLPPVRTADGNIFLPCAHFVRGEWMVSYFNDARGIVLHPFDDPDHGYQLVAPGVDCWHRALQTTPEGIVFALSSGIGEQAGQIRRVIMSAWEPRTAFLALPPHPTPAPTPVPVPVPVPQPKPEPVPMSEPLALSIVAIVARYVAKFPVPQMPAEAKKSDDAFENVCRAWCFALAEQIQFETQDPNWGVKNAGGGRPQSKDSVTYNGPRLINYDMLGGVGTGHPTLISRPAGEDITGQVFMPVKGVDHLGAAPAPRPLPPPAPTPADTAELVRLRADVARLTAEASVQAEIRHVLEGKVADLERLAAHPSYEAMLDMITKADAAYQAELGRRRRKKSPLYPTGCAHLVWRYLLEGYPVEDLVTDAAERGRS